MSGFCPVLAPCFLQLFRRAMQALKSMRLLGFGLTGASPISISFFLLCFSVCTEWSSHLLQVSPPSLPCFNFLFSVQRPCSPSTTRRVCSRMRVSSQNDRFLM